MSHVIRKGTLVLCDLWSFKHTCTATKWAAARQNQPNRFAPSEDSDQPGHSPSLIRVFTVHFIGSYEPNDSSCGRRRLIRLGGCPVWSESLLGAHLFCWFCRAEARIFFVIASSRSFYCASKQQRLWQDCLWASLFAYEISTLLSCARWDIVWKVNYTNPTRFESSFIFSLKQGVELLLEQFC